MMNLNDALDLIALQLHLDPTNLKAYAAEDTIGGWDLGAGGWPIGSLWSVEGKVLYALARALKAEAVVELGSWRGCSAAHLATALSVNDGGQLICVDIQAGSGDLLPGVLNSYVKSVEADARQWLAEQSDGSFDLIFEDTDHSTETTATLAALAKSKLRPGGVILFHDAAHDTAKVGGGVVVHSPVGAAIRAGLTAALGDTYRTYLIDPSDCGFAIYQRPPETKNSAAWATTKTEPVTAQVVNGTDDLWLSKIEPIPDGDDEPTVVDEPKPRKRNRKAKQDG